MAKSKTLKNKKAAPVKAEPKTELTEKELKLLKEVLDHDSVDPSYDKAVIENVKKLNLDKGLLVEALVNEFRDLEREMNYS